MVSGHAGVGKSVLVNEISRLLVRQKGYLIQGKFDQFKRSIPYSAVAVAFRSLIQQLLAESDERRSLARKAIGGCGAERAVADRSSTGTRVDHRPSAGRAGAARTEAQNRFHITFLNFVKVIASEHPLVVFLDDLQFSDASTLNLIRCLLQRASCRICLVIGAYRSNEVDVGHPLRLALMSIEESRSIHELPLRPLDLASPESLWRIHRSSCRVQAVRRVAARKGPGKPVISHRDAQDARASPVRSFSHPMSVAGVGTWTLSGGVGLAATLSSCWSRTCGSSAVDAANAAIGCMHRKHLRSAYLVDHQRAIDG